MSHSVTLGGDRLGSGKKMKVEMRGFERSTHNKGFLFRTTMSVGTLVPFMKEIALPGDTFDIDLFCEFLTHPTIGPLFGSHKVQLDTFVAPIRLYQSALHNNYLGIGRDMSLIKFPKIELTAKELPIADDIEDQDLNTMQINPSCILKYLGISGVGNPNEAGADVTRKFNAIPWLAYWEIYKNYYANKQEEIGAVIHNVVAGVNETVTSITVDGDDLATAPRWIMDNTEVIINYTGATPALADIIFNIEGMGDFTVASFTPTGSDDGTKWTLTGFSIPGGLNYITALSWRYRTATDILQLAPTVATFPLENIDNCRKAILQAEPFAELVIPTDVNFAPYSWVTGASGDINYMLTSQEGLGIKTYQSDLFNNWLNTEWIDGSEGITQLTAIDTSGGSFSIDTLNLSKKVYDMLNRIAVSGGSYDDWVEAVYDHEPYKRAESPMYVGGLIKELVFQQVVSNSASSDQPLGTIAGKGTLSGKHKGGKISVRIDEPSYIIGIVSLTPRIDYSQGNEWDVNLDTMNDLHKPDLDQIGFQELITEQMAWWDTYYDNTETRWVQKSAGKQPAWINYMTSYNKTFGNFAIETDEMFMTLNRKYEYEEGTTANLYQIKDLTTYIDPVKYNNIFAQTALDAQNFWCQIAVDMTVRRKMSAKIMPNL